MNLLRVAWMAGSFGYEQGHYEVSPACGERVLFPAERGLSAGDLVVGPGFDYRHQTPTSATTAAACTRRGCWRWRGRVSVALTLHPTQMQVERFGSEFAEYRDRQCHCSPSIRRW